MTEPLLDAGTIADLITVAASSRIGPVANDPAHTCIIHHRTPGSGSGAPTRGTPIDTTVACLFWAVTGNEVSADALAEQGRYRIDVAAATAIDHTDTVTHLGKTYTVKWAPPPYEAGRIIGLETA